MVEVTKDQLEARLLEEVISRGGQTVTGIQIVEEGSTWRVVTVFDKEVAKLVREVEADFKQIYSVAPPADPAPRRARRYSAPVPPLV